MTEASLRDSTLAPHGAAAAGGPHSQSRHGKVMVAVGWALTEIGIVIYCVVNLREAPSAAVGELANGVEPATRAAVITMAAGVLCWLVGAFSYLLAKIDEHDEHDEHDDEPTPPSPRSPQRR